MSKIQITLRNSEWSEKGAELYDFGWISQNHAHESDLRIKFCDNLVITDIYVPMAGFGEEGKNSSTPRHPKFAGVSFADHTCLLN
jgi:hypothetical protein